MAETTAIVPGIVDRFEGKRIGVLGDLMLDRYLRGRASRLSPEAPAYQNLSQSIKSLEGLIKDIQPLVRTLNEQPNALIFNRTEQADPQPPAAQP